MSARLKLTLSYAGFLVVAGAALIALVFYVIRFIPDGNITLGPEFVPNRSDLLDALWPRALQLLALLAVVGLVGGWFLAGRMLRPLRRIHAVAREVASGSLEPRVRLDGPRDEFGELADTFDAMLDRLQLSFDEQRRFAANASHELRTPYAIERAMLDVALRDPDAVDVRQLVTRLDDTNRRGTEIVEALLALSSLEHAAAADVEPVDIAELVADAIRDLRPIAVRADVVIDARLGEGDLDGHATLIRQLVANLLLNGIRHNTGPGGRVEVSTVTREDSSIELRVANTGPVVDPATLPSLTEPFVRGAGRSAAEGSGLGLSLVARIAEAHHATLTLAAPAEGGLEVRVSFPETAA